MAWIRTRDGAHLHYFDVGKGQPVVLLHGFAMPSQLWLPFLSGLTDRYRFILPSLRGFGASHAISLSQPSVLDQHADDLDDLLAHLKLGSILLGGLSMGACTALQYHRRHGFGQVRAYLHMDQAPCVTNHGDWQYGLLGNDQATRLPQWQALMTELEPYRGLAFNRVPKPLQQHLWKTLSAFLQYAFHAGVMRQFSRVAHYGNLTGFLAPTVNWTIYLDVLQSYLRDNYDWRPSLPNINIPMRVLVGMASTMYPATGQLMIRRWVPHAEIVPIAGCGHAIPFEAPRRFRAELVDFLRTAA